MTDREKVLMTLGITETAPSADVRDWLPRSADQIRSQAWCFSRECMEETVAKQISRWNAGLVAGFPILLHNHSNGEQRGIAHDPTVPVAKTRIRCNPGCRIMFEVPADVAKALEAG